MRPGEIVPLRALALMPVTLHPMRRTPRCQYAQSEGAFGYDDFVSLSRGRCGYTSQRCFGIILCASSGMRAAYASPQIVALIRPVCASDLFSTTNCGAGDSLLRRL